MGPDGRIPAHQRRVGKEILTKASNRLLRYQDDVEACTAFDELLSCVEERTRDLYRYGPLAVYDTALRIGTYLDIWPQVVHLHAGTKIGCRKLGLETGKGFVKIEELPKALRKLEPHHAENFLCIFKDSFEGLEMPKTPRPKRIRC